MLEKVTALVLRPARKGVEILVFEHPNAGLQLPAGTVDPGEKPPEAVLRELREETGLTEVRLVKKLGQETETLPPGWGVLTETVALRSAPAADAPTLAPPMGRGWRVQTGEVKGSFIYLSYAEIPLKGKSRKPLWQVAGWAPRRIVAASLRRYFFWLQTRSSTPLGWEWEAENDLGHTFALRWVPLHPAPDLVEPQKSWLTWAKDITLADTLS